MAFRYRNQYFQDGDAVDPAGWTKNVDEYTQEFNGYLDRDNFPEKSISTAMIVSNAANEVYSQILQSEANVSIETTRWLEDDGTTSFGSISFIAATDGILTAEWSGCWRHPRHGNWPAQKAVSAVYAHLLAGSWYLSLRLVVDGVELCQVPKSINTFSESAEYMVGSIPLAAGPHVVKLQARAAVVSDEGPVINHQAIQDHGVPKNDIALKNRELIAIFRKR
tara:strand:- start:2076 stop:2741 length:666 start_codon:yes stop_codon:yes gene_type:complete